MAGRQVAITAVAVLALPLGLGAADESFRHARVRLVEPGVSLQGASEPGAEEATANMPFLPGDRVWTDGVGRVEFHFADGSLLRVDRRTKLDYDRLRRRSRRAGGAAPLVGQRSTCTSAIGESSPEFAIETPAARRHHARARRVPRRRVAGRGAAVDVRRRGRTWKPRSACACAKASARSPVAASARTARTASTATRATSSPAGTPSWATKCSAARSEYLPEEVSPFAEDFRAQRLVVLRIGRGQRVASPRLGRLAAVHERPLGLDRVRLDLGAERVVGLGTLPLRPLGPLERAGLVLDPGSDLGPGLGVLVGQHRPRGLVPTRLPRPSGRDPQRDRNRAVPRGKRRGPHRLDLRAPGRPGHARHREAARRGERRPGRRDAGSRVGPRARDPRGHAWRKAARCRATSTRSRARGTRSRSCAPTT